MCARFWWGGNETERKVHWKDWKTLTKPKAEGRMGFRDLVTFNKTLLAKQIWQIILYPDSLVARVLKARYIKHTDIMEASVGSNPSYIWRSMMWSKSAISSSLFWKIANGKDVHARKDKWIPDLAEGKITSYTTYDSNVTIQDLITPERTWDVPKLDSLFLTYEVEAIRKIPIDHHSPRDSRFWIYNKKGLYTVKTAYWKALSNSNHQDDKGICSPSTTPQIWPKIWRLNLPPKVRIFLWKAAHDAIASEANLNIHHVPCPPRCVLCGFHWADTNHAIFSC